LRRERHAQLALLLALWRRAESARGSERVSRVRLEAAGLEKRFGRVAALRGVDFEIAHGDSVSILGANGAGKSTLLRILSGLSRPSGGRFEALREGDTAPLTRDALRREVGYVGHATLVYGELSARENLRFAARLHGRSLDGAAIEALLGDVGLLEVADRRAGTFSRGMAQRLSIARAIAHDPQLLLLDEPFTGLDETSAARLSSQLATLREGGRTLVVVTHDPQRAIELSDRALVLHRGTIRALARRGTPDADASPGTPAGAPAPYETVRFELDALRETLGRLAGEGSVGAAA
jgi:heme exporter protein A